MEIKSKAIRIIKRMGHPVIITQQKAKQAISMIQIMIPGLHMRAAY